MAIDIFPLWRDNLCHPAGKFPLLEGEPSITTENRDFLTGGPFSRRPRTADLGAAPLARQGIDRGPPVASLVLALAPWPARRALKIETIESVSRVAQPAPRGRAGDVKLALRGSHPREKKEVYPTYIYPINSDVLYDSSRNTPHMQVTRGSHPSMCIHHAAAGSMQGGCRYVTPHRVAV